MYILLHSWQVLQWCLACHQVLCCWDGATKLTMGLRISNWLVCILYSHCIHQEVHNDEQEQHICENHVFLHGQWCFTLSLGILCQHCACHACQTLLQGYSCVMIVVTIWHGHIVQVCFPWSLHACMLDRTKIMDCTADAGGGECPLVLQYFHARFSTSVLGGADKICIMIFGECNLAPDCTRWNNQTHSRAGT